MLFVYGTCRPLMHTNTQAEAEKGLAALREALAAAETEAASRGARIQELQSTVQQLQVQPCATGAGLGHSLLLSISAACVS